MGTVRHAVQRSGEGVPIVAVIGGVGPGVFGGGRGGRLQQQVNSPGGLAARHAALGQQRQYPLDQPQVVRAAGAGQQRGLGQARVGEQHGRVRGEHHLQTFAPLTAGLDGGQVDRAEQFVQHGRVQLCGVANVDVQRGGTGVQLLRQPAHGHPLQTLDPHDLYGGSDDSCPSQGGLRRPFPPTARCPRSDVHSTIVANMFVPNKFVTNAFMFQLDGLGRHRCDSADIEAGRRGSQYRVGCRTGRFAA
jgi:hypothetical protein